MLPSGGRRPISVTTDGHLVYVLNAGGSVAASDRIDEIVVAVLDLDVQRTLSLILTAQVL